MLNEKINGAKLDGNSVDPAMGRGLTQVIGSSTVSRTNQNTGTPTVASYFTCKQDQT